MYVTLDEIHYDSNGVSYAIWQFALFSQYFCEGNLMMVATATETCR